MFCQQCEQTKTVNGCVSYGQCGKSPEVDAVQDLMIYCLRSLAPVVLIAKDLGINTRHLDIYMCESLFATMTNVNFGKRTFIQEMRHIITERENLKQQINQINKQPIQWSGIANYSPDFNHSLVGQGKRDAFEQKNIPQADDEDIFSLKLTILYGLKGSASYMYLAQTFGEDDENVYRFYYECLTAIDRHDLSVNEAVNLALKLGEINYKVLELLDHGHTNNYGHPVPTSVPLNAKKGKAILVSGHDIKILAQLLEQTVNTGINIYTHGELLPAHGYPVLKQKYPHLYGHFGTGWVNQQEEFDNFPGAILVTTNCLMPPHDIYEDRLFTTSVVGHPELQHIPIINEGADFTNLIKTALGMPGFTEDETPRSVMTGFAHNAVLGVADQVINAVKSGDIRHFFLVGGCDGARPGRTYYTEFVEKVPKDCIVLTLACGKFRFFDQQLGDIGGIPRLLDMGQCNDAYSAIQVTLALADAFKMPVNDLPLSLIISWYEQKAIAVLLTLLYLGIKNIRIGPTIPTFLSPNVLNLLSEQYALKGITTPDEDLAACLAHG
ncbi:MAG TPA: hydroxylamine reductase [Allocoleopsis sp.]